LSVKRKVASLAMFTLLLLSMLSFAINIKLAKASGATQMLISPEMLTLPIGASFTVTINVTNVERLFSWQVILKYNGSVINCTDVWVPAENVFKGKIYATTEPEFRKDYIDGYDYMMFIASLQGENFVNVDNGILFKANFTVINVGTTRITFATKEQPVHVDHYTFESFLLDCDLNEISFDANFCTVIFHGNFPPIARFTLNATSCEVDIWVHVKTLTVVSTRDVVLFDASDSYDPDGTIVDYFWDFGDGSYASGKIVTHRYATTGTFTVTLNVTDDGGLWSIVQKQINVKAPPLIYIRADGSIDPPDAPMITHDNVTYILTANVTSNDDGIVVQRDNIIVDGAGYTLQGTTYLYESKGIDLTERRNVTIRNINIKGFKYGIWLNNSLNNLIADNSLIDNGIAIVLYNCSNHNIIFRNTIATHNYFISIYLMYSFNNTISENDLTCGIFLKVSSNNRISKNNLNFIDLFSSNYNVLLENNVTNSDSGIYLCDSSNYNCIIGNRITNCSCAIDFHGGIATLKPCYNIVSFNKITNNRCGIGFTDSSSNIVFQNDIVNSSVGIAFSHSENNIVYHNNFINNAKQVYSMYSENIWDDGYPSGGNYWSDYKGVDYYSGPYQNIIGNDGIGDTPYEIPILNMYGEIIGLDYDNYPLMNPIIPLKPPVLTAAIDIIPQSLNLRSRGKWITIYIELPEVYNISDIDATTIMLNNTIPIDFEAPVEIGDYDNDTIPDLMVKFDRATVCNFILSKGIKYGNVTFMLSGKLYWLNEILFEGYDTIRVRMPGDLNMDGEVDGRDIAPVSIAFGSIPGHPRWNPIADENEDNMIDAKDIAIVCRNFGKTY